MTILSTQRCLLREMTPEDWLPLSRILQDADVMYAYEHAFSDDEVSAWLLNQQRRYREDGFGLWAVLERQSGVMIGQCGITLQDCQGTTVPEIGYLFRKASWHQGYATETAQACKRYAFETLRVPEIYSIIRDSNTASLRVALRNGMSYRGTCIKHYYGLDMPHRIYSIRKEEMNREEEMTRRSESKE